MIITSKVKDYQVEFVDDVFSQSGRFNGLTTSGRVFYFIDARFHAAYLHQLKKMTADSFTLVIDANEANKSYAGLTAYFKVLIEAGFRRNDVLVTLGGGILQDLSGFIASTLYRGIKWAFVPTTLLAQADSCIGSKTSINFEESKNLTGTFYPPDLILIDHHLTNSLRPSDINSGLGEIIKFHLLSDQGRYAKLLGWLSAGGDLRQNPHFKDIIASTLEIKKSYFDADEFDTGVRNLLNYGHCFGHALESASGFSISHGEAIMIGMGVANTVSLRRGLMAQEMFNEFEALLRRYYPRFDWTSVSSGQLIDYMKKDKKRVSMELTMILGQDVGRFMKLDDIKENELSSALAEFINLYPHANVI